MKNNLRRFSQIEYETLLEALRALEFQLTNIKVEDAIPEHLGKILGSDVRQVMSQFREGRLQQIKVLRQRLDNLYLHDVDMLRDGGWCLGCKRRHQPHCAQCMGCLPEELPE